MKTWLVNKIIKFILHIILKLDTSDLVKLPLNQGIIAAANHVNFLDAPVMITHLPSHKLTGLIKKETWENPIMAFLFNLWSGIPIDRDVADFAAFRQAVEALENRKVLAVAPEGTRTEDGRLIRGKPGITILALKTNAPIFPIAYYGHEDFKRNFKRLRRTPMTVRVGEPFRIDLQGQPKSKEVMQDVTDSIMLEIAALLPEKYHGFYRDKEILRGKYIKYLDHWAGEQVPEAFGQKFPQTEISS
jgi:1-acyl-sn-glycerol-3-phosphate acyltransferase